jgi:hypothetical protein
MKSIGELYYEISEESQSGCTIMNMVHANRTIVSNSILDIYLERSPLNFVPRISQTRKYYIFHVSVTQSISNTLYNFVTQK